MTSRFSLIFNIAFAWTLSSANVFSSPVNLNGLEIKCGRVNMYFGDDNIYYTSPSVSDFNVADKSILDGSIDDRYQLTIAYDAKPLLVRTVGCQTSSVFCQKEYLSGRQLNDAEVLLIHRKEIEFLSTPSSNPGIAWQILQTLIYHNITVRAGYSANLEIRQKVTLNEMASEYYYSDSEGRKLHNDLWEGWGHDFRNMCSAL